MGDGRRIKPRQIPALSALVALATAILSAPITTEAQPSAKIARIGLLGPASPQAVGVEDFRRGLRDLGYVEGQNITIEYRWAQGRFERLPDLAAELIRVKPDVMVTLATQASVAARDATKTIPIVMVGVADPVGSGLVTSLARPGANITGTSNVATEVVGKQLELIRETLPKVSRVAVLWNPANAVFQALQLKETKVAAQTLGVELQIVEARDAGELDRGFVAITRKRPGALLVLMDPVFTIHRQRIVDFAAKRSLPAVSGLREFAEAGGLMAYGPSYPEAYRRAATYVDKILKGARPADLPVEQPTKFETVVNLKTARAFGLTIPQALLLRAEVIE